MGGLLAALHAQYCLAAWLSPPPPAVCEGTRAASCVVFSRVVLHLGMHLLMLTEKMSSLMWMHFVPSLKDAVPIPDPIAPGSGKVAWPGGIHLPEV